jgi:hypothetical protein
MDNGSVWVKKILMDMGKIWIKKKLMDICMKIPSPVSYPIH